MRRRCVRLWVWAVEWRLELRPVSARTRLILHVDMDAFYASVEQRDHPELRGKPVLVGGSTRRLKAGEKWIVAREFPTRTRGVVTTASYEARVFGCRSAMPMAEACRLCPHALVVPISMGKYVEESRKIRAIFETFTPDIQPISIDEAFLDLSRVPRWAGGGLEGGRAAAVAIRERIKRETGLTASVGVSGNKFLAKIASDMNKPDGLTVIEPERAAERLSPMSVGVIFGIGAVTRAKLATGGVRTIGDLLNASDGWLSSAFGSHALEWKRLAQGEDDREVQTSRQAKSIGKERTFGDNIGDPERLRAYLMQEVENACARLREDGLWCRTVSIKCRTGDFRTFTRAETIEATDETRVIWAAADRLFGVWLKEGRDALRLLGVSLSGLETPSMGLFGNAAGNKVDLATDAINAALAKKTGGALGGSFGRVAIQRARGVMERGEGRPRDGEHERKREREE